MLLKVIGWLLMIESVFMLIPMFTALGYGEDDWIPFGCTALATAVVGWLMSSKIRASHSKMGRREGFLLTAGVWVVFSIFGMQPLIYGSPGLSITDAYFETMSGFTTTGATIISSHESLTHAVHIWLALIQWLGGMGIILFTLAVLPMLNSSGGMQMFNAEVTGITHDKVRPRISQTAKTLWGIYMSFTLILLLLLWVGPMDFFDSVCHAFGTMSTGGYSTHQINIEHYDSLYVDVVIMIFMFFGGMNFALIYNALTSGVKSIWHNSVFRVYVCLILFMTILTGCSIIHGGAVSSWQSVTIKPLFQVISALSTTGYTLENVHAWGPFFTALLIVMVYIGGCAGSTSGGSKLDRTVFLAKHCVNELSRCVRPNAVLSVKMDGKVQSPALVNKVVAFQCFYMILTIVGGILLTVFGMGVSNSIFAVLCCMGNTGFGVDVAAELPIVKWLLSLVMLIGRLEIFTILVLLTPTFWRKG